MGDEKQALEIFFSSLVVHRIAKKGQTRKKPIGDFDRRMCRVRAHHYGNSKTMQSRASY